MLRYLGVVIALAVILYAAFDIMQSDRDEVRVLPRGVWLLIDIVFPVIGAIAWFVAGRPSAPLAPGGSLEAPGPRGPDDDPDFLRKL